MRFRSTFCTFLTLFLGEVGLLVTNDAIKATEHRVQRPLAGSIERYCMALFFDVSMDMVIDSTSTLTTDSRYKAGGCSYQHWSNESFKRYIVAEE